MIGAASLRGVPRGRTPVMFPVVRQWSDGGRLTITVFGTRSFKSDPALMHHTRPPPAVSRYSVTISMQMVQIRNVLARARLLLTACHVAIALLRDSWELSWCAGDTPDGDQSLSRRSPRGLRMNLIAGESVGAAARLSASSRQEAVVRVPFSYGPCLPETPELCSRSSFADHSGKSRHRDRHVLYGCNANIYRQPVLRTGFLNRSSKSD